MRVCVFSCIGIDLKEFHCFDPSSNWLYVSWNEVFLESVTFVSIVSYSPSSQSPGMVFINPFKSIC